MFYPSNRRPVPLQYSHHPVTVAGKTAVVIGGTSGIGRAIAIGSAEEGADVVATSRTPEKVERTAEEFGPEIRVNAMRPGFVVTKQTKVPTPRANRVTRRSRPGRRTSDSRNRRR